MARAKRLNIKLSEKEYELIKQKADEEQISMAEYIRDLVKKEALNN